MLTSEGVWANAQTMNAVDGADLVRLIHDKELLNQFDKGEFDFHFGFDSSKNITITEKRSTVNVGVYESEGCKISYPMKGHMQFANGFRVDKDFSLEFHIPMSRVNEFFDAQAKFVDNKE